MLSLTTLTAHIWPFLIIFMASLLQAITGFGLVIITAPLMMLFYDVKVTVLIMALIGWTASVVQLPFVWRDSNKKMVLYLVAGYMASQYIGLMIYTSIPNRWLKIAIVVFIVISLLLLRFSHYQFRQCPRNTVATGFLSGITAVTTSMGGPPLILYFAYSPMSQNELRGTSITFFLLSGALTLGTYFLGGVSLDVAASESRYLVPAMILGILAGQWLYPRVSPALFRRLLMGTLYFICAYTLYQIATT